MTRIHPPTPHKTPEQARLVELAASVGFVIAIVIVALWTRVMRTDAPAAPAAAAPATSTAPAPSAPAAADPAQAR